MWLYFTDFCTYFISVDNPGYHKSFITCDCSFEAAQSTIRMIGKKPRSSACCVLPMSSGRKQGKESLDALTSQQMSRMSLPLFSCKDLSLCYLCKI